MANKFYSTNSPPKRRSTMLSTGCMQRQVRVSYRYQRSRSWLPITSSEDQGTVQPVLIEFWSCCTARSSDQPSATTKKQSIIVSGKHLIQHLFFFKSQFWLLLLLLSAFASNQVCVRALYRSSGSGSWCNCMRVLMYFFVNSMAFFRHSSYHFAAA